MMTFTDPWVWLSIGGTFLILELLLSGSFLLSYAISALFIAAGVAALPSHILTNSYWGVPLLFVIWSAFGLIVWAIIAKVLKKASSGKEDINHFTARVEGTHPPTETSL
jgi:membrane protein implicated in regulation of membrane protease activity